MGLRIRGILLIKFISIINSINMSKIIVVYNGNINLPADRNHMVKGGIHQLEREFNNVDEAIHFWLECGFYFSNITTLEELLPVGYESELLNILGEEPLLCEEIFLDNQKELYQLTNEDDEDILS
jgi:hypothetical protein